MQLSSSKEKEVWLSFILLLILPITTLKVWFDSWIEVVIIIIKHFIELVFVSFL